MTDRTQTVRTSELGSVELRIAEEGSGRPILLLHGGAGPRSMAAFSKRLAAAVPGHVLVPTHPGFDGTERPAALDSVPKLAGLYLRLFDELDLDNVAVVGNSVGGWVAAEMAVQASATPRSRVGAVVLADAAGLQVDGSPIPDVSGLTLDQIVDRSYYNPDAFRAAMTQVPEALRPVLAANRRTLQVYSGTGSSDPTLATRLAGVRMPALVVWGLADRMIPPAHGEAYAKAIPGARYVSIPTAGHMPPLETPDLFAGQIRDFLQSLAGAGPRSA
jgi:pimeloyl-ACP methyl ester carboxylesterase